MSADAATYGWLAFAGFLAAWLAYDLHLHLAGRRTYSQVAYSANMRYHGLLSLAFGGLAGFLIWHLFG